jgi:ribonuclease PH
MTGRGAFVEVQGTGEEAPFTKDELNALLAKAEAGIADLIALQQAVLGDKGARIGEGVR